MSPKHRPTLKLLTAAVLLASLPACKIQMEVPKGGRVVTESGAYRCSGNSTCEIEVVDQFFEETFLAQPREGYMFMGWANGAGALCGGKLGPCELSTAGFEESPRLLEELESDRVYTLTPIFEAVPAIAQDELQARGNVIDTEDGFDLKGSLELSAGDGPKRLFRNANLSADFTASGDLERLDGRGILPRDLTAGFTLDSDVKADIGYFTGEEINANEDIPIQLIDERSYLVFLVSEELSYSWDQRKPPENVDEAKKNPAEETETYRYTMNTPASGKIIMILDPHDDMIYRYGETPLVGAFGHAESDRGLIPFVPWVEGDVDVEPFYGHEYETISMGVGIKALDVFNLTGEQVVYQPKLYDINLEDPFNSTVAYKAGFNGAAEVAISVYGFSVDDLFDFELGEASASFQVSKQKQSMTLAAYLEPEVRWLPGWVPFIPTTRLAVELKATGKGAASMSIEGSYESSLPRADVEGSMRITPEKLTLRGEVVDDFTLPISVEFRDGNTYADVGITRAFDEQMGGALDEGFDRLEDELNRAIMAWEEALEDYEFELSLRGLRDTLPGLADTVTRSLNPIPGIVYDEVYERVKDGIDARNKCVAGVCLVSKSTRNSKARSAASKAEDDARDGIKPALAAMKELKRSALEDNDESLIESMRLALRQAYAHRIFYRTFRVTVKVAGISVTKSYTVNERLISEGMAARILTASENLHRIPETSNIVVQAQQVIDYLPTQQIIDQARDSVESELVVLPGLESVSYSVIDGEYLASAAFSDGSTYSVDFNVLSWDELSAGVADLLVEVSMGEVQ